MAARPRLPIVELLGVTLVALLLFAYRYLEHAARGHDISPLVPLIEEGTGVFGAGALFFLVRRFARRHPLTSRTWMRRLPRHAAALVTFSATHTTLNWLSRSLLFPLAGLGAYDYGRMPVRYLMEFPIDVILYTLFVGGVWLFDRHRDARERALRAEQLERQLAQAQLQTLRLQLQPHFLFNTLNTISSTMFDDAAAADDMLARLAELLRVSLTTAEVQELALDDELYVVDLYLSIARARFGEAVAVVLDVEAEARRARVPTFLLQPLVENALTHGGLRRHGRARLAIRAARQGDILEIVVADDGGGPGEAAGGRAGIGLSSTRERLRLLYGPAAELRAGAVAGGGFEVRIRLPWRAADDAAAPVGNRHARAGRG